MSCRKRNFSNFLKLYFLLGGFETGSIFSVAYDGSYIATMGDVIVVPIQYRLGSFGFLYGQTEDTPGNAGLYDQIAALKVKIELPLNPAEIFIFFHNNFPVDSREHCRLWR